LRPGLKTTAMLGRYAPLLNNLNMLKLNNNEYKLCLLDSNLLCELLKDKKPYFSRLLDIYPPNKYVYCYSIFSILEIRKIDYVFNKFIDTFSVFPSLMLTSHDSLFDEEVKHYLDNSYQPEYWLVAPHAITDPIIKDKKIIFRSLLNNKDNLEKERRWINEIDDILENLIKLVKYYPPKNNKYTKNEILDFVFMVTTQQIGLRNNKFAKSILDKKTSIDINKFPSLKMISYNVFYKFYAENRKPLKSDVFDLTISSLLPYVDVFITEGYQNEVINKVKQIDIFINHLENISIKDFFNNGA
jgi:hypothetical protein